MLRVRVLPGAPFLLLRTNDLGDPASFGPVERLACHTGLHPAKGLSHIVELCVQCVAVKPSAPGHDARDIESVYDVLEGIGVEQEKIGFETRRQGLQE